MFSNLTQGNILYGIDKKGDYSLFSVPVERVTLEPPTYRSNGFGQVPEMRVTIVTNMAGEHREFQKVPANNNIADFGDDSVLLADSKESLNAYIDSIIQNRQKIIDSYEPSKKDVQRYSKLKKQLNPSYAANDEEIASLKQQLQEAIALLKEKTNQTNN